MPSALSHRLRDRALQAGIDTVQGVGDTRWVWQKLYHHVPVLNLNILTTGEAGLQQRAVEFLRLLPKVERVTVKRVSQDTYNRVCALRRPVLDVAESAGEYAVNFPLEQGIRLEDIDPGAAVEWSPGFRVASESAGRFSILYVSGSKPEHTEVWSAEQWAMFYAELNLPGPHLLLGAPYDRMALLEVQAALLKLGVEARVETGLSPADSIRIIRDAQHFVGYQSGLGIIADAYDVPQIMVYFPHLRPMLYTWCKPGHAGSLFRAYTFDQRPEEVLHEVCAGR